MARRQGLIASKTITAKVLVASGAESPKDSDKHNDGERCSPAS